MSYLKYSNLCADMLRSALKEPAKAKAKAKEVIYFRTALWKNGVPEKQGEHLPGRGRRRRCRRTIAERRLPPMESQPATGDDDDPFALPGEVWA